MQIYTVIWVDTFGWECKAHPESESLRVFKIKAETVIEAVIWAREFLIDEFGMGGDNEWRVVAVMAYEGSVMDRDGLLIDTHETKRGLRE